MYSVKEIFYTLQGEGMQSGRPAVFVRFSGCNLWSGLERDRDQAICRFCDTDFVGTDGDGGGKFDSAEALAETVKQRWPQAMSRRFVVLTGGEPLLQLDSALLDALHRREFEVAVESNGTMAAPEGIDWLCISPKAGATLVQTSGNELKVVFPQPELDPDALRSLDFDHFLIQPMDGPLIKDNTRSAIAFCLSRPQWQLSLQTHKWLGIR